jgi:hypothetical protein
LIYRTVAWQLSASCQLKLAASAWEIRDISRVGGYLVAVIVAYKVFNTAKCFAQLEGVFRCHFVFAHVKSLALISINFSLIWLFLLSLLIV